MKYTPLFITKNQSENNMILFKIITFVLPITIMIFGISKIRKQLNNK